MGKCILHKLYRFIWRFININSVEKFKKSKSILFYYMCELLVGRGVHSWSKIFEKKYLFEANIRDKINIIYIRFSIPRCYIW